MRRAADDRKSAGLRTLNGNSGLVDVKTGMDLRVSHQERYWRPHEPLLLPADDFSKWLALADLLIDSLNLGGQGNGIKEWIAPDPIVYGGG